MQHTRQGRRPRDIGGAIAESDKGDNVRKGAVGLVLLGEHQLDEEAQEGGSVVVEGDRVRREGGVTHPAKALVSLVAVGWELVWGGGVWVGVGMQRDGV